MIFFRQKDEISACVRHCIYVCMHMIYLKIFHKDPSLFKKKHLGSLLESDRVLPIYI